MIDNIGTKIKKLRNEYSYKYGIKLTQKKLAENIGISRSYLNDIESGRTTPNPQLLKKIANGLKVKYEDLIETKDNIDLSKELSKINDNLRVLTENKPVIEEYDLDKNFPQGIKTLKEASKVLNDKQKEKMIELMQWFIDSNKE